MRKNLLSVLLAPMCAVVLFGGCACLGRESVSARYRTPGIIGGMGPSATCDLMQKIIDNLRQLRVRDLLTMNTGAERTDAERDDIRGDWIREILANEFQHAPGTGFRYDSAATHLLAAIVERKSGRKLQSLQLEFDSSVRFWALMDEAENFSAECAIISA